METGDISLKISLNAPVACLQAQMQDQENSIKKDEEF
jgi:hypothetical protein